MKLFSPVLMKLAELSLGLLYKTISNYIDDWLARRKEKKDAIKIDEAFKNPNRTEAAGQLDDVFRRT